MSRGLSHRWRSLGRPVLLASAVVALACVLPEARAQNYPTQPIRIVAPFSPGSATDLIAREVAAGLTRELGQTVAIDNRPGGGAVIGVQAAMTSPPDGYTILLGSSQSHATNSSLFKKLPYDPIADFEPVARITLFPAVLAIQSSIPATTVAEFVAWIKKQPPGSVNYGSSGAGTQGHLQSAMLSATAGVQVTHIPFKETGQIFSAFERGDIQFMMYPYSALGPVLQSGRVRVLAQTGETRMSNTPNVPTMAEAGFPDLTMSAWSAFYVPARTPARIIERLDEATRKVLQSPQVSTKLAELGIQVAYLPPAELSKFTKSELERYRKIVAVTGVKLD